MGDHSQCPYSHYLFYVNHYCCFFFPTLVSSVLALFMAFLTYGTVVIVYRSRKKVEKVVKIRTDEGPDAQYCSITKYLVQCARVMGLALMTIYILNGVKFASFDKYSTLFLSKQFMACMPGFLPYKLVPMIITYLPFILVNFLNFSTLYLQILEMAVYLLILKF